MLSNMNYLWYGIISVSLFLILLIVILIIALFKNRNSYNSEQEQYAANRCSTCGQILDSEWSNCPFCTDELKQKENNIPPSGNTNNQPIGYLMVKSGANRGQVYKIDNSNVDIGNNNRNDIIINDARVSSQHVKIWLQDKKFFVQDLNSQAGTRVNNRVIDRMELKDNDQIDIVSNLFIFKVLEA
jgi:pSer/pThr/pTyr-binding forkhead associated (FHA) protein